MAASVAIFGHKQYVSKKNHPILALFVDHNYSYWLSIIIK